MIEQLLMELEKLIRNIAGKFYYRINGYDFEDLVQVGRITAWEIIDEKNITLADLEEWRGYIYTGIKYKLLHIAKKARAKKRIPSNKMISLDEERSDNKGGQNKRKLHEIIVGEKGGYFSSKEFREIVIENKTSFLKGIQKIALTTRNPDDVKNVVWTLISVLDASKKEIPTKINYSTFVKFGLQRYLWVFFNNSPFRAINFAYPGEFLPYEMPRKPKNYWRGESGKQNAIDGLRQVLKKTGYSPEFYPKLVNQKFLEEFFLYGAVQRIFKNIYDYLDAAFPGEYCPWELSSTPKKFFDSNENITRAVKWLVEKRLGYDMENLSKEEVWQSGIDYKVTKETFQNEGLREITAQFKSPEPVLRMVYPDKFLPWSFRRKKKWQGANGKELAARATRWLVEEYGEISPFSTDITCEFFRKNRLWGMLTSKELGFNTSPKAALKNAYPDLNFDQGLS